MTSAKSQQKFRLPDPPVHPDEQMTNFDHIALNGTAYLLSNHFGDPATTLIAGERFLVVRPTRGMAGSMYPDLLIAFDVDPVSYKESNGYTIDEQGKPPDFVMEIASRRTGRQDIARKRDGYAALGIPEYWRFDETGEFHRTLLAGDRLATDGQYQPIAIEEVADGILQGYSHVLNLLLRWENGQLRWHNPETGRRIASIEDERDARIRAEEETHREREALIREREARLLAEARVRELEARLESLENQ